MKNKLKKIANHFGEDVQSKKLGEEFCELLVEIALGNKEAITMEMADCLILIMQKAYQLGIKDEDIEEAMDFKVNRTIERIKEGYYGHQTKDKDGRR